MERKTFRVPNMACNGCVNNVRNGIEQVAGVVNVDINKPAQLVTVEWQTPASWEMIEQSLIEIDYAPAPADV